MQRCTYVYHADIIADENVSASIFISNYNIIADESISAAALESTPVLQ